MDFDIRTPDKAYEFVLNFLQMSGGELCMDYLVHCGRDYEKLWTKHFDKIDAVDISDMRFIAFHITSNWDDCSEIKANGLQNLQKVLSGDTSLRRLLSSYGVDFDIDNCIVYFEGQSIDIKYDNYRGRYYLSEYEEKIERVSHRVYYDYTVDGFYVNDNVFDYGSQIHERPEFFIELVDLFPQLEEAACYWKEKSKSYKITFYANFDQLAPFSFDLYNFTDPPFEDWHELTVEQRLKKQMLSLAIDRAYDDLRGYHIMFLKDEISVPPSQILSYEEIHE